MKLLFVCLSSAIAALATKTSAVSAAGADVAALFNRKTNLNEGGDNQLQADPRRLSTTPVTCDTTSKQEEAARTATFSEKTLQASFTCGNDYTTLVPQYAEKMTKCCENAACANQNAEIATILGVKGKAVKKTETDTYTVTIEKILDDKRGKKIYYKCKKSGGAEDDFCLVTLALPAAIGPNDCAIDRVVEISLGKTTSSATFKCAGGEVDLNRNPFGISGGKCSDDAKQTTAVKLTKATTGNGEYQLTVDQLPSQAEQLCYKCTYTDVPTVEGNTETTPRACSVIVNVEAAASSTTTVTTTSSARSVLMTSGVINILIAMVLTVCASN